MDKKEEYFLGYIRNPKEIITNGFQDVREHEIILVHEFNDYFDEYREVITKEKLIQGNQNKTFDGHEMYKNHAGLIGRVGKKLSTSELNQILTDIRKNHMSEYIDTLTTILKDTEELIQKGEQEYREEREKFASAFKVNANDIPDKTTYKSL